MNEGENKKEDYEEVIAVFNDFIISRAIIFLIFIIRQINFSVSRIGAAVTIIAPLRSDQLTSRKFNRRDYSFTHLVV